MNEVAKCMNCLAWYVLFLGGDGVSVFYCGRSFLC